MFRNSLLAVLLATGCVSGLPPDDEDTRSTEQALGKQDAPRVHRIQGPEAPRAPVSPAEPIAEAAPSDTNGITLHGGPVMTGGVNIYYIWYGNWSGNTATTILPDLADHIGGSPYWNINTTYFNTSGTHVSSTVEFAGSTTDAYSHGTSLTDAEVFDVVSDAITRGDLPKDTSGVYFVLTSPDVHQSGGSESFCTDYCGWHHHGTVTGSDIKYSFVGNAATQCPDACMAQSNGPNGNGGADGMASVIAHELEEAATDPDLDAWWESGTGENADKCAWTFGAEYTAPNGTRANVQLGSRNYLIQRNWVNAGGGYCSMVTHYGSLGGSLTSAPAVASWASGRLDVFARGEDNALWHKSYDSGWSGWESLGGVITSDPAAVSWGNGRIDVFARGEDNAIWHKSYAGGWSGWESLGGTITSNPAAVSWGVGHIDVFARGQDMALWHKSYAGGWSGWGSQGGTLASAPAVASWASGRLDVFARSTDNTLLHKYYSGGWSGYESLGNTTLSSPAAVSWGPGRIDVFMRAEHSAIWQKYYNGSW